MIQDRMPIELDTLCLVTIANMNVDDENGRKCILMVTFFFFFFFLFFFSPVKGRQMPRETMNANTRNKKRHAISGTTKYRQSHEIRHGTSRPPYISTHAFFPLPSLVSLFYWISSYISLLNNLVWAPHS